MCRAGVAINMRLGKLDSKSTIWAKTWGNQKEQAFVSGESIAKKNSKYRTPGPWGEVYLSKEGIVAGAGWVWKDSGRFIQRNWKVGQ
jgi:hypothetical protein